MEQALDAIGSAPGEGDMIFAECFRSRGPAREIFGFGCPGAAGSPLGDPEFEIHRINVREGGITAEVTLRGVRTGCFQSFAPDGRCLEGVGVVAFDLVNGRITTATSMLCWRSAAD